ncbi:prealbumin-like fold domain-containing protein [Agromyces ramosus]|uniref:Repeat protein (TIGR01451 family) n=1 Tax=Agromyces ramosus TaxID=33879 RepID=A0ABU0RC76_9MICO|nr:DUF5979 domain-containing protein [Agromyces ramosus]MDQ0895357.1 hypothetical protein [Agromyces ramosus]
MTVSRRHARTLDALTGTRSWRLEARRARRKLLSSVAITALLASGGIVVATLAPAQSASAATLGPIQTSFEIDGNTAGANDWQGVIGSTPKPPYVTASGDQSTGIITAQRTWDDGTTQGSPGVCGVNLGTDDIFVSSTKLDDPSWPQTVGTANDKGDACTGGSAYEVVTDDGVQHTIFYAYWTRYSGSGDMTSYEVFEGPAAGRADDYLIEFNYNSGGGGSTSVRVLGWDGNSWEPTGATVVYQAAVGKNTDTNTTGNAATFGELAIDLTASGLLPSGGACRTFLDSGFITKTGEGGPATLKDILVADAPITLSNCGGLVVKKVANPADATSGDVFDYTVNRTGGGLVHDGTLTGPVLPQGNNNAIVAPIGVGDTHNWGNVFAGNDYQLAETVDAGQPWAHQSTVCTVTNPSTNQLETYTNQPFKLYIGANTTCVITNATSGVKITKVAQGDATAFDFTVNGTPVQVAGGQSSAVTYFVPGSSVTINEIAEAGTPAWHLTGLVCDQPATTNLATGTAVVTTVAGQITNCTFTNQQDGAIKIIKNVAGANGTFDFTTTVPGGPFSITTTGDGKTGSKDYTSVPAGIYTVTETTPAPAYDLTGLSCTDDATGVASTGDMATGVATINLEPGELVTCTYTNTQRGNIIVTKQTNPDGSSTEFDFTLTGQPDFNLADGESAEFNQVKPGAYTLTEAALDGWDVTSMTCTGETPTTDSPINLTLDPGETVTCTVLNAATKGRVTVEKKVTGVPAGYDWSFPISITPVPGGQQGTIDATDEQPIVEWKDLNVGTQYTLTEGDLHGWDEGTITCTGIQDESDAAGFQFTVTPGLSLTCAVTNDAEPGEVSVTKTVAGVAAGTAWEFDLTIDPADEVDPSATQTVSGIGNASDTVTWSNLVVGEEYTITEALPAGWTGGVVECGPDSNAQLPGDQFVVTPGFTLSCTVLNTAIAASAKITKTSVGASGSFTFVLTPLAPAGPAVEQIIQTPVGGGTGETTFANLVPGATYSLAEKNPGDGWIAGDLVCTVKHAGSDIAQAVTESGFTVQAGDVFTCDITNTAKGKIVIVKNIDGADGAFQFTGTWPWDGDPSIGSFAVSTSGGTGANTYDNVVAGSYSVTEMLTNSHIGELVSCTETRQGGADHGSSIDANTPLKGLIDLDPGETVTCVYSNTELSSIIIDKVVPGVGSIPGGAGVAFPFTFDNGDVVTPFTLTDADPSKVFGQLVPGTYTVNEGATANWELQGLVCSPTGGVEITAATAKITLAAGQTVTCTYSNVPDAGDVTVRKIVAGVPQGYPFDFAITISPAVTGQDATQHVTQGDASVSWTNLVVGQTYTLTEGDVGGWNEGAIICEGLTDAGAAAGFQFLVTPGLSLSCTVTNTAVPGQATVTKHVTGVPEGFEWDFDLTISPSTGVLPSAVQTVSGIGDVDGSVTWTNLQIDTVYTVTEGELPEGWTGGQVVCTDADPATTGNQFVATPGATLTCDVTNDVVAPTGQISKDLTSIEQNADGTWDLVYEVTVANQSPVAPLVYDLDDEPFFGVGVVINESSATGPSDEAADWDAEAGNFILARDASVPASEADTYIITINATAGEEVFETSQQLCQEGDTEPGGFRNTAFLTVGDGDPQPATDCAEPGRAVIEKKTIGSPENLGLGTWEVDYEVVVTSESDLPLFYDLEDELGFPVGVTIVSAVATNDAGVDTSDWDGDAVTVLAEDEVIAPLDVHTYTITVVANVVNITTLNDVTCVATTSGKGFFNGATLENGTIVTEVSDCATIPVGRIQLLKTVDNAALAAIASQIDLGNVPPGSLALLTAGDWNLTGNITQVMVKGDAGLVFTVPTGDYSLAEAISEAKQNYPLLAYYFAGDWMCGLDGGPRSIAVGDIGTVELGHLTSCTIENTAESVDVSLEKEYELAEGETSVEAGDEFDYRLTVRNNGTLAVPDLDVSDAIDPQLEVTGPATFDGDGTWTEQPTVGDNAFAAHGVGPFAPGDVTTITIPVRMLQPAPVEAPDVVGPNDPPPVIPPVNLDDIPNEACVAITPVEGGLQDLISTNNCDEVELPQRAIDAGAYPRCVNDVPWLYFNVQVSDSVEPGPITVTWTSADPDGDGPAVPLVEVYEIPWDERSGRLLWPGAAVDENGIPYQFPGWRPITEQDLITPPTPGTRYLDLILDETVPTYPWRDMVNPATVTFSVNPSQEVLVTYPQALPTCAIVRPPELEIEKTASVASTVPGGDYEYTLSVTSVGTGAAEPVEVFDTIPANLRVDSITTDPAPAFPRWENCEVTGENSSGYGGVLHCDLLGVLGPNLTTAPDIVLGVHVNPSSTSTLITNVGEVCWSDADVVDDTVIECAEDKVDVKVIVAAVARTGVDTVPLLWGGAGLLVIGAMLIAGMMIRRRRAGDTAQ